MKNQTNLNFAVSKILVRSSVFAALVFGLLLAPAFGQFGNMKQTEDALKSASVIVLGRELIKSDYDMLAEVGNKNPKLRDAFLQEGLNFSGGVTFYKTALSEKERSALRLETINRAYKQVFGRASKPQEQARWDAEIRAQKIWFMPLTIKLTEELNANAFDREVVIQVVYYVAMGRTATKDEIKYWMARKENYVQMLNINRKWLYTSQGAKDLAETVARAVQYNTKKKPTDAQISQAMMQFGQKSEIYVEMTKQAHLFQ